MKLLTYHYHGANAVGVMSADLRLIYPLSGLGFSYDSMQALIECGTKEELAQIASAAKKGCAAPIPYGAVDKRSPIPMLRRDMICIGYNFRSHAEEIARLRGEAVETASISYPIYFVKRTLFATPDGGEIPYFPGYATDLDCGVEVAVVIGKDALNVAKEQVNNYIFGYTITNDICDTRINKAYTQPFLGKSLDGYMPVGPWIVTPDEFEESPVFDLKLSVNGSVRQQGSTRDLVFDIPYIISELTRNMTLKAGTMISTGSPANLDAGDPDKLRLRPGNTIVCEIGGIGALRNTIAEKPWGGIER